MSETISIFEATACDALAVDIIDCSVSRVEVAARLESTAQLLGCSVAELVANKLPFDVFTHTPTALDMFDQPQFDFEYARQCLKRCTSESLPIR